VISVIMPAYNAEKYIGQAIESVLNQTYQDFELIIVDDGSTDRTAARIGRYDDRRIKYTRDFNHNLGIVLALNRGLELAKGDYIARHDADDISEPTRFEKQVAFLDTHPEYAICGTWMKDMASDRIYQYPEDPNYRQMLVFCYVAHPTVMMRREVYDTIGGYDEDFNMGCCEDYDYWLRIVDAGLKIYNIPEVLYSKRNHPESNIGRTKRETIQAFDELARLKSRIRRLR